MKFAAFLGQVSDSAFWQKHQCFYLHSNQFYSHFFTQLIFLIKDNNTARRKVLPCKPHPQSKHSYSQLLRMQLEQSFLGTYNAYWLGNLSMLAKKERTAVFALLNELETSHYCFWFIDDEHVGSFDKRVTRIEVPRVVDADLFAQLNSLFGQLKHPQKIKLAQKIVTENTFNLDQTCALLDYLSVISVRDLSRFYDSIPHLFEAPTPLFKLSNAFFARNAQSFYTMLKELEDSYPLMFWVAFWSEQLWRAYGVVHHMEKNNFVQAKRMSFRLPSTFVRQNWQQFCKDELAQAHQFIYTVDYVFKKGCAFPSLDLFYSNHFTRSFRQGA